MRLWRQAGTRGRPLALAALLALCVAAPVRAEGPTPLGVWQDSTDRIQVEIWQCGDWLCGTLVWFLWPDDEQGLPVVDLKNHDPALRGRPLLGLTILRNLVRRGDNAWGGGNIYNPEDGAEYRAVMSIQDDTTLRVRIYALAPLFGKTKIWTRIR